MSAQCGYDVGDVCQLQVSKRESRVGLDETDLLWLEWSLLRTPAV